jgi:Tfp pilus assembly protein PilX
MLKKLLRNQEGNEAGAALIIVLVVVAVGGLLASATLGFANTVLKSKILTSRYIDRVYAADAGIENTLACIKNNTACPTSLPQSLNNTSVSIQIDHPSGTYTLCAGQWVAITNHNDWVSVFSQITALGGNLYNYTITIAKTPACNGKVVWLTEVGAQIPDGFTYAASTSSGLSSAEPSDVVGTSGSHILTWDLAKVKWSDNDPRTESFTIQGTGQLQNYYSWVVGMSNDINVVGELTGGFYTITSTATTADDNLSTQITANVMTIDSDLIVLSWRINP